MSDVHVVGGNVGVSGDMVVRGDDYTPFKVEISSAPGLIPTPPKEQIYLSGGHFHLEARKGIIILREKSSLIPRYLLNVNQIVAVNAAYHSQIQIYMQGFSADISFDTNPDVSVEDFINAMEAAHTGQPFYTYERFNEVD